MRWGNLGDFIREEVYPINLGLDLYFSKGHVISANSLPFNQLKLKLREFEYYFNNRRCEHLDLVGTYRPYHFNQENFGLYIYAHMFGMYLLSILNNSRLTLRESHTLALDSILTHGSFHYLIERYCTLMDGSQVDGEKLYTIYKKEIYSQVWGTQKCIEETLANAFVLEAYPSWDKRYKDYLRYFYSRQREGYFQACHLKHEDYRELLQILELQLTQERGEPSLFEFIQMNIPFRYLGLPVYLVNDCEDIEVFLSIVQVLFPLI